MFKDQYAYAYIIYTVKSRLVDQRCIGSRLSVFSGLGLNYVQPNSGFERFDHNDRLKELSLYMGAPVHCTPLHTIEYIVNVFFLPLLLLLLLLYRD